MEKQPRHRLQQHSPNAKGFCKTLATGYRGQLPVLIAFCLSGAIAAFGGGNARSQSLNLEAIDLSTEVFDTSEQVDRTCADRGRKQSRFVITGRRGMPPNPYEPLSADEILADVHPPASWMQSPAADTTTLPPPTTTPNQLVEAQGWVINPDGKVMLTAPAPSITPQSFHPPATCDRA